MQTPFWQIPPPMQGGEQARGSHVLWSAARVNPVLQLHRKLPNVLMHEWEQRVSRGSTEHSSISTKFIQNMNFYYKTFLLYTSLADISSEAWWAVAGALFADALVETPKTAQVNVLQSQSGRSLGQ